MKKIMINLKDKYFSTAVSHMMKDDRLEREILLAVSKNIHRECKLLAKDKEFMRIKSVKDVSKFNFHNTVCKIYEACPVTSMCLSAIIRRKAPRTYNWSEMRVVTAMSVLLYERNQHVSQFQKAMSILLYNGQLQTEVSLIY